MLAALTIDITVYHLLIGSVGLLSLTILATFVGTVIGLRRHKVDTAAIRQDIKNSTDWTRIRRLATAYDIGQFSEQLNKISADIKNFGGKETDNELADTNLKRLDVLVIDDPKHTTPNQEEWGDWSKADIVLTKHVIYGGGKEEGGELLKSRYGVGARPKSSHVDAAARMVINTSGKFKKLNVLIVEPDTLQNHKKDERFFADIILDTKGKLLKSRVTALPDTPWKPDPKPVDEYRFRAFKSAAKTEYNTKYVDERDWVIRDEGRTYSTVVDNPKMKLLLKSLKYADKEKIIECVHEDHWRKVGFDTRGGLEGVLLCEFDSPCSTTAQRLALMMFSGAGSKCEDIYVIIGREGIKKLLSW